MRYRAAVSDDLNPLFQLEQQLFSSENYPVSRRMFKYHLEHNFILLAENESQEIVGYILALRRKTWAKIYSLGVSSKYRGAGVGFVLLKEMLEYLHHQDKK
ncbi:GNAT family N-acetyltransferase, partial [bacterium]|nr:GNAT family N-acetyltransferase [bacterium]